MTLNEEVLPLMNDQRDTTKALDWGVVLEACGDSIAAMSA